MKKVIETLTLQLAMVMGSLSCCKENDYSKQENCVRLINEVKEKMLIEGMTEKEIAKIEYDFYN